MFLIEFVKGALLISVLPIYMGTDLGLSTYIIGWSFAFQYIGDNIFRSPMGWIMDHIGYRLSMLFGVLITFIAVGMIAFMTHFIWMIIACALLGVGTSPLWPCVLTGITGEIGERARGTMMSVIYIAWLFGVGLGPIVINFFVDGTYRYAFHFLILIVAAAILLALFLPSRKTQDKPEKMNQKVIKQVNRMDAIKMYFVEIKNSLTVSKLMFPAMFLQTFALGLLTPVLTLYIRTEMKLSPTEYSFLLITGGIVTVLLLLPIGKMVDRWGTYWFLNFGLVISSGVLLLFTYTEWIPMLFILVGLLGLGYAFIIPSWNALIAAAVPSQKRGAVWGLFLTIEGFGMIVGPIVSGKMWDAIGPSSPFITSGMVLIILLIVHIYISSRQKVMVR